MTKQNNFHRLIGGFESVLSDIYGIDIELQVYPKDFDKTTFLTFCEDIKAKVGRYQAEGTITLKSVKKDVYYLSLKLCMDKYPYLPDKYFAEAFSKDRTTILAATKTIERLLEIDELFKKSYNTLLNIAFV